MPNWREDDLAKLYHLVAFVRTEALDGAEVWLSETNGRQECIRLPRQLTVGMSRAGADCLCDTLNASGTLLRTMWNSLPETSTPVRRPQVDPTGCTRQP